MGAPVGQRARLVAAIFAQRKTFIRTDVATATVGERKGHGGAERSGAVDPAFGVTKMLIR